MANWDCRDLLEANVAEIGVRDVSDIDPPDLEDSFPFVGCPHGAASCVVNLIEKKHHEGAMGCKSA